MPRFLNRYFSTRLLLVLLPLLLLMSLPGGQNSLWNSLRPTASAASTFTVNSNGDTGDSNPGDGVCNDGSLACTLRAAIQEANALAGDDNIVFHASVSAITLNTALPDITSNLTIAGPGATLLTIQRSTAGGTPDFRILTIGPGLTVILSRLTFANGKANGGAFPANSGGGIYTDDGGTTIVSNCVVSGNVAAVSGGGIYNRGSNLTIDHSTISNNTAAANGAGVNNNSSDNFFGGISISDSTISNNVCGNQGGGLYTVGFTTVRNSTISTNSAFRGGGIANFDSPGMGLISATVAANNASNAGGGLYNPGAGSMGLFDSLVANNTAPAGPDCGGSNFSLQDYNLIGNTSGSNISTGGPHDQLNVNPLLGPLAANGGPTLTHALLPGSPAIDAATSPEPLDQRGQSRLVDDPNAPNVDGTNLSDIGAYEAAGLLVNSTADADDGACTTLGTGNGCTLREAIIAANAQAGSGLITFAAALTAGGPATITLSTALPDLAQNMLIAGPGANHLLTVQRSSGGATPNFRIFTINSGVSVSILGLTVTNGRSAAGTPGPSPTSGADGGGILNRGTLTLTNVLITGNRTGDGGLGTTFAGNGGKGGGIANTGTLTMINSTVSGNSGGRGGDGGTVPGEGGHGGGIANFNSLTMTNCVVNGNSGGRGGDGSTFGGHGGNGGGIYFEGAAATAAFTSLTVSNNTAGDNGNTGTGGFGGHGGGLAILHPNAVVTMVNSSVTGNSSGNSAGTAGFGGGIMVQGTLSVTGSTVSGNTSAGPGGGIIVQGTGIMTLSNSTVSGNNSQSGGGIYNDSSTTLALANATITGNSGTGILTNAPATVRNSIIAGNGGPGVPDVIGPCNSQGHNLVGNAEGSSGFNGIGDQVGSGVSPLNPRLGPLANNGGLTRTHALLAGSPALDAADDCVTEPAHCGDSNIPQLTTDQRGTFFGRLVDGPDADATNTVDIGAFEAQISLADIADQTINEDGSLSLPFNVGGAASIMDVATSSNSSLVPNSPANISISGVFSTRTLTINPVANVFGTSTITVTVNSFSGQTMTDTFLLTVNSVNDAPSFTKGPDQTVNENDGAQTSTNWASLILQGPANESGQAVNFIVTNNSNPSLFAVAPVIAPNGTLTYTPATGVSGTALITIALTDNGGTANGGVNTSATQSFNISVLEGGALQFSSPTFATGEAGGNALITVSRTGGTAGEARINYATSNGTATEGQDYTAASGTLIFPAGITSTSFNVAVSNDVVGEPDETINLTLASPAGSGSLGVPASAVLTITNDDLAPGISINDVSTTEGDSGTVNAIFTVTLSGQSSQTVTVDFATANGTATAGSDYQSGSGTLTFLPPETTKTITVTINGDTAFESNETFLVNLSNPVNATISDAQGTGTISSDDPLGGRLVFNSAAYTVSEADGSVLIAVNRNGDATQAVTVEYATSDITADGRKDYTAARGTLRFDVGETLKTFPVLVNIDAFAEGSELAALTLSNPTGAAALGGPSTATLQIDNSVWTPPPANSIDNPASFVRQHYHDFLNREPDADGLAFWTNQITECQQPGATCNAEVRRINVSAAFFLSIEFQQTGYLVERIYKASYGDAIGNSNFGPPHQLLVPAVKFNDFLPDTQQIGKNVVVGQPGWELVLEANKQAFIAEFVLRPNFQAAYPTILPPDAFVNILYLNAGLTPSDTERASVVNEFGGAMTSANAGARARALRRVAENSTLADQEKNKAFVLMQYFGYLRRNPNDAPDADHSGYDFWLTKLNQFNGNFVNAEMVKAFLVASEYRQRFGQ